MGDQLEGDELPSEGAMGVPDNDFTQGMEIALGVAAKRELRLEAPIELTAKDRLRPAGSLGHGGQTTVFGSKPMDDQAGVAEGTQADDDAFGSLGGHGAVVARRREDNRSGLASGISNSW